MKSRDYKKEYKDYHSKPTQKKNRAKRNRANRNSNVGPGQEVDHKVPLSRGGSNTPSNWRVVSKETNRKKGSKKMKTAGLNKLRVALLSGSTGDDPEELSRSRALAEAYRKELEAQGATVDWMDMRDMGDMPDTYDWDTDWYDDYKKRLTDADAMVVSTPIFNYGPSGRVMQFLHRTLDKENQQYKPYALLSGAGSPRSAMALGGLANQLDTEIKGIGIGSGVQLAGDEFNVETGEIDPGVVARANENARKLYQVASSMRSKKASRKAKEMHNTKLRQKTAANSGEPPLMSAKNLAILAGLGGLGYGARKVYDYTQDPEATYHGLGTYLGGSFAAGGLKNLAASRLAPEIKADSARGAAHLDRLVRSMGGTEIPTADLKPSNYVGPGGKAYLLPAKGRNIGVNLSTVVPSAGHYVDDTAAARKIHRFLQNNPSFGGPKVEILRRNLAATQLKGAKGGSIALNVAQLASPTTLMHELGHATGNKLLQKFPIKAGASASSSLSNLAGLYNLYRANTDLTQEEKEDLLSKTKMVAGVGVGSQLPLLLEEARASIRAQGLAKKFNVKLNNKLLRNAYGTYLAQALANVTVPVASLVAANEAQKTAAPKGVERLPSGGIKYRGETFPGYNKPKTAPAGSKHKKRVLAKKGDKVKVVNFGARGYRHNYSAKAKKSYLARSAGIKGKDDKFSANYWSRRNLWPKNQKADGSSKKTAAALGGGELLLGGGAGALGQMEARRRMEAAGMSPRQMQEVSTIGGGALRGVGRTAGYGLGGAALGGLLGAGIGELTDSSVLSGAGLSLIPGDPELVGNAALGAGLGGALGGLYGLYRGYQGEVDRADEAIKTASATDIFDTSSVEEFMARVKR